jgi:hypothetical protein
VTRRGVITRLWSTGEGVREAAGPWTVRAASLAAKGEVEDIQLEISLPMIESGGGAAIAQIESELPDVSALGLDER